MIRRFNHMSFTVADMDRAARFWTETMGFEARSVSPRSGNWQAMVTGVSGAELLVAHLYGHGMHLELIQYLQGGSEGRRIGPNESSAAHVCFEVEDIEESWRKLLDAGARAQGEIALVDSGPGKGLRAGYLRDPDGILIELVETAR
ncbi:MAG TPA: VOC family protein [Aestuariivirgaceae bacterium]|jgi:catechol 2,3-dioxygenase-like lactoylglutathione lyase family enzyme